MSRTVCRILARDHAKVREGAARAAERSVAGRAPRFSMRNSWRAGAPQKPELARRGNGNSAGRLLKRRHAWEFTGAWAGDEVCGKESNM